jgi:hypothetical protein
MAVGGLAIVAARVFSIVVVGAIVIARRQGFLCAWGERHLDHREGGEGGGVAQGVLVGEACGAPPLGQGHGFAGVGGVDDARGPSRSRSGGTPVASARWRGSDGELRYDEGREAVVLLRGRGHGFCGFAQLAGPRSAACGLLVVHVWEGGPALAARGDGGGGARLLFGLGRRWPTVLPALELALASNAIVLGLPVALLQPQHPEGVGIGPIGGINLRLEFPVAQIGQEACDRQTGSVKCVCVCVVVGEG